MPRPKGSPRTPGSGRKKGTPNQATAAVKAQAAIYTVDAVTTLAEIMRNRKAPPAARVMAARELLDRAHGKPAQGVDVTMPEPVKVQFVDV